jgi:hypothetical protein
LYTHAISVNGLGIEPSDFWAMTPRELEAHSKVADQQRELISGFYAGLQATLHNAHFKWPDKKGYTPKMFLGGQEKPTEPQWKRDLAESRSALMLVKRPDPNSEEARNAMDYSIDRTRRAIEAKQRGEPREVIEKIMTGTA